MPHGTQRFISTCSAEAGMAYTKDRSITALYPVIVKRDRYGPSSEAFANVRKLTRTRTGDRNPRFRDQIELQQNATTQMSGIFDDIESVPGGSTVMVGPTTQKNTSSGHLAMTFAYSWWTPSISVGTADNRAMQSFLKNIRRELVAVSGPTFMGELRESIRMIRQPAQNLAKRTFDYLTRVKRAKRDRPKKWKQDLSGLWLEYSFGWVPLLSDISAGYKAYESLLTRGNQRPVSGYGIHEIPVPSHTTLSGIDYPTSCATWQLRHVSIERAVVRYRGMVSHKTDATLWGNRDLFGFTPAEFLPTAWELLPWSFLIDYFTNIGDIVGAVVTDTSRVSWANKSTITFLEQRIGMTLNVSATKAQFPDYISHSAEGSSAILRRRYVQRDVGWSAYVPPLELSFPGKPAQWANMAALFLQAVAIHPQKHRL